MKNCSRCKWSDLKDISRDENEFPEYIYVCRLDNHYIGYDEDLREECCDKWDEKSPLDN